MTKPMMKFDIFPQFMVVLILNRQILRDIHCTQYVAKTTIVKPIHTHYVLCHQKHNWHSVGFFWDAVPALHPGIAPMRIEISPLMLISKRPKLHKDLTVIMYPRACHRVWLALH